MRRVFVALVALAVCSGIIFIAVASGSGTAQGQGEVRFTGTVMMLGQDPEPPFPSWAEEEGPFGWWNIQVEDVLMGTLEEPTVDVYGPGVVACLGSIEVPHDDSTMGQSVEVRGWYDGTYHVDVCGAGHYMRTVERGPTPTATPEAQMKSITVLKLDDETDQPLSGWGITLYGGSKCEGPSIGEAITNATGMVDFVGLPPSVYSVQESLGAGHEAVSPTCQSVDLTDPPEPPGPCPIVPNLTYPDAGCDVFDSGAAVKIDLSPIGQGVHRVTLNGPTQIARSQNPLSPHDGDSDGLRDFDTEIVHLDLQGTSDLGPITVTESPSRDSAGSVEEQSAGGDFFPADSFFDVFVEVDTPAGRLHNEEAFRLECEVNAIPPLNCFYFPTVRDRTPLLTAGGGLVGYIRHGAHIPLPDREILVVFWNRPRVGPTEELSLFGGVCSPVASTYPDATPADTIAGAVTPPGALEALWQMEAGAWLGFSPEFPQASNLTDLAFLDVAFICVGGSGPGAATFTRPTV